MKILVTGGLGQLGRSVARRGAASGHQVDAPGSQQLDIRDQRSIETSLAGSAPALVINAAAYTAVDRAESEAERAFAINRDAAGLLARSCARQRVPLLHVSTDYVFDGTAHSPYAEDAPTAPLNVYGQSKLEGERAVLEAGGVVVRTSWLFEQRGPSFVHTMLRLAGERETLRVVADQHGCPTWADDLADALLQLAAVDGRAGVYHYCGAGATTWHGFATAIIAEGRRHRDLRCTRVEAITTADYPTPAKRPAYTVMSTQRLADVGIAAPSWTTGMQRVVATVLGET